MDNATSVTRVLAIFVFLDLSMPTLDRFQLLFAGLGHHGSSASSNVNYIQQLPAVPNTELLALMCQFGQN